MKITLLTGKIYDIKDELGIDIKVVPSRSFRRLVLRIDRKEENINTAGVRNSPDKADKFFRIIKPENACIMFFIHAEHSNNIRCHCQTKNLQKSKNGATIKEYSADAEKLKTCL